MKEEIVENGNNENVQDNMPMEKISVFKVGKTLVEEELNELGDSNEDVKEDVSLKCKDSGISKDKEEALKKALDKVETFAKTTVTGPSNENKKHNKEMAKEVKVRGSKQETVSKTIKKEEQQEQNEYDKDFENERG